MSEISAVKPPVSPMNKAINTTKRVANKFIEKEVNEPNTAKTAISGGIAFLAFDLLSKSKRNLPSAVSSLAQGAIFMVGATEIGRAIYKAVENRKSAE